MTDQGSGFSAAGDAQPGNDGAHAVTPFLLGAAAGGLAGIAAALLLSGPVRLLAGGIARRFGRNDGDELRFELLLQ